MAQTERFEAACGKCGRRSEIFIKIRQDGFNDWESFHCAWCGLKIDDVKSACTPKSVLIDDASAPKKDSGESP